MERLLLLEVISIFIARTVEANAVTFTSSSTTAVTSSGTTAVTTSRTVDDAGMPGKWFSRDVIFTSPARSALDCVIACSRDVTCLTASYDDAQRRCRGHSAFMSIADDATPQEHARTFALQFPCKSFVILVFISKR